MTAVAGNRAAGQSDDSAMPDAADVWDEIMPSEPPPLTFADASGAKLSLGAYRGHVLVVNLWATWCGPCMDEMPGLAALALRIKSFGGLVLPVSIDVEGAAAVRSFYNLNNISGLPILLDPEGHNLDVLGTNGVPDTIVVNPEGLLVAQLNGGANWNTPRVVQFLRSLAPVHSKPPAPAKV